MFRALVLLPLARWALITEVNLKGRKNRTEQKRKTPTDPRTADGRCGSRAWRWWLASWLAPAKFKLCLSIANKLANNSFSALQLLNFARFLRVTQWSWCTSEANKAATGRLKPVRQWFWEVGGAATPMQGVKITQAKVKHSPRKHFCQVLGGAASCSDCLLSNKTWLRCFRQRLFSRPARLKYRDHPSPRPLSTPRPLPKPDDEHRVQSEQRRPAPLRTGGVCVLSGAAVVGSHSGLNLIMQQEEKEGEKKPFEKRRPCFSPALFLHCWHAAQVHRNL